MRVLVVEDEPDVGDVFIDYLLELGHQPLLVRSAEAALGTLAVEGSAIQWVANHRKHHNFADEPEDPHSPHQAGGGIRGTLLGLAHAWRRRKRS